MENTNRIQLKTYIESHPSRVWKTISSVSGMKEWLGAKEYEAKVGGKIRFEVGGESSKFVITGTVKEMVPEKKLSFTWLEEKVGEYKWPTPTLVTITLNQFHTGTLVVLEHSGFNDLPSEIALSEFLGHFTGWTMYFYPFGHLMACVEKYGS